jgi:hypothetical protein
LGKVIFSKSVEQVYAFSKNHERCHLFAKEVNKTIQSKDEEGNQIFNENYNRRKKKSQKYKSYNRSKQFEPNEFYKRVNGQEHIIKLKGKCTLSTLSLTHLQVTYLFKK